MTEICLLIARKCILQAKTDVQKRLSYNVNFVNDKDDYSMS